MIIRRVKKHPVHFRNSLQYLRYRAEDLKYHARDVLFDYLSAAGAYVGRPICGPKIVQIDITNRCNNNCVACWDYSPLLPHDEKREIRKKDEIPLKRLIKLIDELHGMGTRKLYIAGGGEPFFHPNIMDVLRFAKGKGMEIEMNTNFTLMTKERLDRLIDWGVDHIKVSIWSGTPETYARVHPNKSERMFHTIKENLRYLGRNKKVRHVPHVCLYSVITSQNYRDIPAIARLGLEVRADSIQFVPVDSVADETKVLVLDETQRKETIDLLKEAKGIIDSDPHNVALSNLFILEHHQFLRRISSDTTMEGEYEKEYVSRFPCYAGWNYARILADGTVNFCLKSSKMPMGSIYGSSFAKIWASRQYNTFRLNARNLRKTDPFFSQIRCTYTCDNIRWNEDMHQQMQSLTRLDKKVLKAIAELKRRK